MKILENGVLLEPTEMEISKIGQFQVENGGDRDLKSEKQIQNKKRHERKRSVMESIKIALMNFFGGG